MINATTAISQVLLDKVKATQQAVTRQMTQAASDLEILYHLSNQLLVSQFEEILTSDKEELQKKEALKQLLFDRWQEIKGTSQAYCTQPRDPLNQLCLALALFIAPLPDDLSECDDWAVGEGPYFVLMPDLEACNDIVLSTNIHQYKLHEFILSEDSKRYIPLFDALSYFFNLTFKKPVHMVFTEAQMADNAIDKKNDPLTDSEIAQLTNHSEITVKLMQNLAILKDPGASFFNRLSQLADGLFAGSSHGGAGQADNAAAQANEAIVEFFHYWDGLPKEMREFYLKKVPKLGPILQRLSDPVSIAQQGVNYCVGVTGGDLRHEVGLHRRDLQSGDITQLQDAVKNMLNEFERLIKEPGYALKPVKSDIKPLASRVVGLPVEKQKQLLQQYLRLDYPNFIFYAFDQQPAMVKRFIDAFQRSPYQRDMLKQRSGNGMSLLMVAAQSDQDVLSALFPALLALDTTQLKEELMLITPQGESLFSMVLQRQPQILSQLVVSIRQLNKNDQLQLLTQTDANQMPMLMMVMESNPEAFSQLCELIGVFSAEEIANILRLTNPQGERLLMAAFRNHPQAIAPLIALLKRCKSIDQKMLVKDLDSNGLNLSFFALTAEAPHFQSLLDVMAKMPADQLKPLISTLSLTGDSFFLRASCSKTDNFNAALVLFNHFSVEEQGAYCRQSDRNGNHLLLSSMLHQNTPSALLFDQLKKLTQDDVFAILTTKNHDGISPFVLALTQRPEYFTGLADLLSGLSKAQQAIIWQQVGVNGWYLPFLASVHAPEHFMSVFAHVDDNTRLATLKQSDLNGNGLLARIAGFNREQWPDFMVTIKAMSIEQRYLLLSHCNQQGDNLLSWVLQQDVSLLDDLLQLMQGFSVQQQVSLMAHCNCQGQQALTIAYAQGGQLFDVLAQSINQLNGDNKEMFWSQLPLSQWFDLLSLACTNSVHFSTLYDVFLKAYPKNQSALAQLLAYHDVSKNNLLMVILRHNPSLVNFMIRTIKALTDEKAQRQIMLQCNIDGQNVLSLAEKFTPDQVVASLQSLLKRVDKQASKQMMLGVSIKMHSADVLISSETLDQCDAYGLVKRLQEEDAQGNNLLGQMVLRMPHHLPVLIEKMQKLLLPEFIKELFAHKNAEGLNLYRLALKQPQAAYLCHQIQCVINHYNNETKRILIAAPEDQSIIELALAQGESSFITTMCWIDKQSEANRDDIMGQFWQKPSEPLQKAIENKEVAICQRLVRMSHNRSADEVVTWMSQNRQALMIGLQSAYQPIKSLMCQWLLGLPPNKRFDVLSTFSVEVILSLLDNEDISLIDALPLSQQIQLFSLKDDDQNSVIMKAFHDNHSCREKLIKRLMLLTPEQWATLFQDNEGLHALAQHNKLLFAYCLTQLRALPSAIQLPLFNQVDGNQLTPLDYLQDRHDLYAQVLSVYDHLSVADQVRIFSQKAGPNGDDLLIRAPQFFRKRLFEQFLRFPQSSQIKILLSMNEPNNNRLLTLMQSSPWLQFQMLEVIDRLPKSLYGVLFGGSENPNTHLIHWMLHCHQDHLQKQAIHFMAGMTKGDVSALLKQRDLNSGHHLLQMLVKNAPVLFDKVFSIFMTLSIENKVEILLQQNGQHMGLFADLVEHKNYDQFERLCQLIAELPNDDKVRILSASGVVPVESTTLWVSVLYDAPQSKRFIHLMNNKAFFKPMFHLLQTLPPQIQLNVLNNRSGTGKNLIDEIVEPEQSQLRLVIKQAEAFKEAKKLLDKMAAQIPNEQIHGAEFNLHQLLVQRLDAYHGTYYKGIKHLHELSKGWAKDIEEAWPHIENKFTFSNILIGLLKLAACLLMPIYGGYKLYEKVTTNRNVLFQTDKEKIIYGLEDAAMTLDRTARQANEPC